MLIKSAHLLTLLLLSATITSCGYVSKSTVHTRKDLRAFNQTPSQTLPPVTLKVGERIWAYKNRVGFPPMVGGFIPSLLAHDPRIVKAELVDQTRGFDTYLIGLKPGVTRVHLVNGLVNDEANAERLSKEVLNYEVRVLASE